MDLMSIFMGIWSVLQLFWPVLLFTVLPWLLRRKNASPNSKPIVSEVHQQMRWLLFVVLVAFALFNAGQIFLKFPRSIYDDLGITKEASSFDLKRAVNENRLKQPTAVLSKTEDLVNRVIVNKLSRDIYDNYGENALDCSFCNEPSDYTIFAFVDAFASYVLFSVVATMATSRWDTGYLRWFLLGAGLVWVGLETLSGDMLNFLTVAASWTVYQRNFVWRRLVFGALPLLAIALAKQFESTDKQLVEVMIIQTMQVNEKLDQLLKSRRASARP